MLSQPRHHLGLFEMLIIESVGMPAELSEYVLGNMATEDTIALGYTCTCKLYIGMG